MAYLHLPSLLRLLQAICLLATICNGQEIEKVRCYDESEGAKFPLHDNYLLKLHLPDPVSEGIRQGAQRTCTWELKRDYKDGIILLEIHPDPAKTELLRLVDSIPKLLIHQMRGKQIMKKIMWDNENFQLVKMKANHSLVIKFNLSSPVQLSSSYLHVSVLNNESCSNKTLKLYHNGTCYLLLESSRYFFSRSRNEDVDVNSTFLSQEELSSFTRYAQKSKKFNETMRRTRVLMPGLQVCRDGELMTCRMGKCSKLMNGGLGRALSWTETNTANSCLFVTLRVTDHGEPMLSVASREEASQLPLLLPIATDGHGGRSHATSSSLVADIGAAAGIAPGVVAGAAVAATVAPWFVICLLILLRQPRRRQWLRRRIIGWYYHLAAEKPTSNPVEPTAMTLLTN